MKHYSRKTNDFAMVLAFAWMPHWLALTASAGMWVTPAAQTPGVEQSTFKSRTLDGAPVSYHVVLPQTYAAMPDHRFPVIYWLHGLGGGRQGVPRLSAWFDAAMRRGDMPPALIVFPNGLVDSMWSNSKDGTVPMETVIIEELIPHIDAAYRTIATREGRVIEGFSMGGYGAGRLGFKYPELFGAVSILGGGPLQPDFSRAPERGGPRDRDAVFQKVYGGDPDYYLRQSPWWLAEQSAGRLASTTIRVACGREDFVFPFNEEFSEHLRRLQIPHAFHAVAGIGHSVVPLLNAMGPENLHFYQTVLLPPREEATDTRHPADAVETPDGMKLHLDAAYSHHAAANGLSLLVLQNGDILFERYADGVDPDTPQWLASGTKSFLGVIALAAVADGLIQLDAPVHESITEWRAHPRKSEITYRQLLTLTSGLQAADRGAILRSPSWANVVASPMIGRPGDQFGYGAFQHIAFSEAVQRLLDEEPFEAYMQRRLFDPLGVEVQWLYRNEDGDPEVGGGAAMTARHWARFGEFVRQRGHWEGEQLIPANLFAELTVGTQANPAYGLAWWLNRKVSEEVLTRIPLLERELGGLVRSDAFPSDVFIAAGAGKQRLYIIPSMELVIVRQGQMIGQRNFNDADFLSLLLHGEPSGISAAPLQRGGWRRR